MALPGLGDGRSKAAQPLAPLGKFHTSCQPLDSSLLSSRASSFSLSVTLPSSSPSPASSHPCYLVYFHLPIPLLYSTSSLFPSAILNLAVYSQNISTRAPELGFSLSWSRIPIQFAPIARSSITAGRTSRVIVFLSSARLLNLRFIIPPGVRSPRSSSTRHCSLRRVDCIIVSQRSRDSWVASR